MEIPHLILEEKSAIKAPRPNEPIKKLKEPRVRKAPIKKFPSTIVKARHVFENEFPRTNLFLDVLHSSFNKIRNLLKNNKMYNYYKSKYLDWQAIQNYFAKIGHSKNFDEFIKLAKARQENLNIEELVKDLDFKTAQKMEELYLNPSSKNRNIPNINSKIPIVFDYGTNINDLTEYTLRNKTKKLIAERDKLYNKKIINHDEFYDVEEEPNTSDYFENEFEKQMAIEKLNEKLKEIRKERIVNRLIDLKLSKTELPETIRKSYEEILKEDKISDKDIAKNINSKLTPEPGLIKEAKFNLDKVLNTMLKRAFIEDIGDYNYNPDLIKKFENYFSNDIDMNIHDPLSYINEKIDKKNEFLSKFFNKNETKNEYNEDEPLQKKSKGGYIFTSNYGNDK